MKVGFICWKQGGGTSDYIIPDKSQKWLKELVLDKGHYKGKNFF